MNLVDEARLFAVKVHHAQLDKGGQPFILHPLRVGDSLKEFGDEVQAAGYLHDTIEDTDTTFTCLLHIFGPKVADIVLSVTRYDPTYDFRLPLGWGTREKETVTS